MVKVQVREVFYAVVIVGDDEKREPFLRPFLLLIIHEGNKPIAYPGFRPGTGGEKRQKAPEAEPGDGF
jgi:hypothetical protein